MALYFARAADLGVVKIGHSQLPRKRLVVLQAWSPVPLEFAAVDEAGDWLTEAEMLWRFREARSHGEWFRETPPLAEVIRATARTGTVPGGWYLPAGYSMRADGHAPAGATVADLAARFGLTPARIREALEMPACVMSSAFPYGISLKHLPALYDYLRRQGAPPHYRDLLAPRPAPQAAA